jgi:hypothetical protein
MMGEQARVMLGTALVSVISNGAVLVVSIE